MHIYLLPELWFGDEETQTSFSTDSSACVTTDKPLLALPSSVRWVDSVERVGIDGLQGSFQLYHALIQLCNYEQGMVCQLVPVCVYWRVPFTCPVAHCQSHHVCLGKSWQAALPMRHPSTFVQSSKNGSQALKKAERLHPNTNACAQDRNFSVRKKHSQTKVSQRNLSEFYTI